MKDLKVIPAVFSLLVISGCGSSFFKYEKYEIDEPVEPVIRSIPEIECVVDEMTGNEWYSEMCSQVMEFKTSCTVNSRIGDRDVYKALIQLHNDYPEVFWIGNTYYATTVTDGSKIVLGIPDWFEADDIPEMNDEFAESADKLIKSIPEGSDYDKILYVHDYIVRNTEYDRKASDDNSTKLAGTAYGCLVEGKAVCSGYARAFQYIMNQIGIESGICTGSNHAWNYVKLDGEYYWLDTTWDDVNENYVSHTYFLFDDDMLIRTRSFDMTQSYVPECKSDNNYFVRNGGYFTEYDKDSVISYIEDNSENEMCEIMFADFESYKSALHGLFGNSDIRSAKGMRTSEINYYHDDNMFTVRICK